MAHNQRDGLGMLALHDLGEVLGVGFAERVNVRRLGADRIEEALCHAFAGFGSKRGQQHRGCELDAAETQIVGMFGFGNEVSEYGLTLVFRCTGEQTDFTRDVVDFFFRELAQNGGARLVANDGQQNRGFAASRKPLSGWQRPHARRVRQCPGRGGCFQTGNSGSHAAHPASWLPFLKKSRPGPKLCLSPEKSRQNGVVFASCAVLMGVNDLTRQGSAARPGGSGFANRLFLPFGTGSPNASSQAGEKWLLTMSGANLTHSAI